MNIHLTALIRCKPGHTAEFKPLLEALVKASNEEEACLKYELYQTGSDDCQFIFQETWKDQDGLDQHNKQAHLLSFLASAEAREMPHRQLVMPMRQRLFFRLKNCNLSIWKSPNCKNLIRLFPKYNRYFELFLGYSLFKFDPDI